VSIVIPVFVACLCPAGHRVYGESYLNPSIHALTKSVNIASRDPSPAARKIPITSDIPKHHVKAEVLRFFLVLPEDNLRDRVLFDLTYRQGLRRPSGGTATASDRSC
jgi:hypothetical protein